MRTFARVGLSVGAGLAAAHMVLVGSMAITGDLGCLSYLGWVVVATCLGLLGTAGGILARDVYWGAAAGAVPGLVLGLYYFMSVEPCFEVLLMFTVPTAAAGAAAAFVLHFKTR